MPSLDQVATAELILALVLVLAGVDGGASMLDRDWA